MRTLVLAFSLILLAVPAFAQTTETAEPADAKNGGQTVEPADAKSHIGQTVTVEGPVDNVHTARSGNTFIDIGGHYPNNTFAAVIFSQDASKFPNVSSLKGKTVDVSGKVRLYRGKAEIILTNADQLKAK
jgi:DNA/RNA endonuclease YhcR with UshA esterase domain